MTENTTAVHSNFSNFSFLKQHDSLFFELAYNAERVFSADPNTTLIKVRQLCEALAQSIATKTNVQFDKHTTQSDLLYKLKKDGYIDKNVLDALHILRKEGNVATHNFVTSHREAIDALRLARSVCVWYHQSFGGNSSFKPEKFITPKDPSEHLQQLKQQISQLSSQLNSAKEQADTRKDLAELEAKQKQEYEELLAIMQAEADATAEESKQQEQLLKEENQRYQDEILALQIQLEEQQKNSEQAPRPKLTIYQPDEEETRILIDEQLRQAGWITDSKLMDYRKGERPERGKNKAIAEWTFKGSRDRADYVLFIGLTPVATVEAKKQNINVAGNISQAERYAKQFAITDEIKSAKLFESPDSTATAWQVGDDSFTVPFVLSSNGRPFFKQLPEQSGIWFRDVRKSSNLKRPIESFFSPEGLKDLLERDVEQAEKLLANEPFGYLKLRHYQEKAIQAVESNLANGQRECLLAMATGTGKTRTIIGLMYRFLKSERFKRILFLVDRTALGKQAFDSMQDAQLEQSQPLSKIYNIAELGDMQIAAETRVQVATVQALVKRIYHTGDTNTPPAVDQYDCIIIDEAHRGYTLDQEMTEGEAIFRNEKQYLSSYRRVLDYFDAVKIGLTATPALHTKEIFGEPVYTYSYREAVAEDWLIDYEPPYTMETELTTNGINFVKGEEVPVIDTSTGNINLTELADDMAFDVASFNRNVITEGFNKVICHELANHLDPTSDEKTMIFCATDRHADMVVRLLGEAFKAYYGEEYNQEAVKKITGASDKVNDLISKFKTDRYPNVAVTVDLLTTGIDVPKICNLVFLRRVRSRILFEQMIGRATRRCDEIGKTYFKVFDPVRLFETLEPVNSMKPLVKKPNVSIQQLMDELLTVVEFSASSSNATTDSHATTDNREPATEATAEATTTETSIQSVTQTNEMTAEQIEQHKQDALDHLSQKLMQVLRKAKNLSENNEELKTKLEELEDSWGVPPENLHTHLKNQGVEASIDFLLTHNTLTEQLAELKVIAGSDRMPIIYQGEDKLVTVTQNLDDFEKPEDYIESFTEFVKNNLNESVALNVVATKPRDMTRETLKEVKLLLDNHGYTKAKLQTAWRNKTNQDITASIVGHIRQAALGEALIPFATRVDNAMAKIYQAQAWKPIQKKWLERIAKQLKHETIVDREFINTNFKEHGGEKQLDKILDNQLDEVLSKLNEYLWVA